LKAGAQREQRDDAPMADHASPLLAASRAREFSGAWSCQRRWDR
jgi:hypothetical protein